MTADMIDERNRDVMTIITDNVTGTWLVLTVAVLVNDDGVGTVLLAAGYSWHIRDFSDLYKIQSSLSLIPCISTFI